MNYIIRDIPADLHRRLKIAAIEQGKTLNRLIISMLAEEVDRKRTTKQQEVDHEN